MIELGSPRYRLTAFALAFGSFLIFCNLYLFQPMLPVFAAADGISETRANWLLAATTLGLSFSLVPWAVLSERIGRRPVMLVSLWMLPVIGLMIASTSSFWIIVGLRALVGIALGGFAAVAVAYMAEEFSPEALAIAVGSYISANSLGGISGRVFGGMMTDWWGWHGAVMAMAVLSLVGVAIVSKLLPRQRYFSPGNTSLLTHSRGVLTHLRTPKLWLAMMIGGINFALFVNLFSVMAFRLVAAPYQLPVSLVSSVFVCYLAGTVTSRLSGRWVLHFGAIKGMAFGTGVAMLGVLVTLSSQVLWMVVGLLIVSGGAFFTHSLAYGWVSRQAAQGKATATALYLVHYYIGGSLGGFYLIAAWQHFAWPGVVIAALVLITILLGLVFGLSRVMRRRRESQRQTSVVAS
ncbi:MFS transporter [Salinivibrio siamensis]|uniref:MFS transporter n=1 Tax=Salinivibrio siamensis TaxID=414286 RepID=A0ABX3K7J1_9GAMM|nr:MULTISPECIES: MFS transporter [Salinivibrio]OOE65940.1 MFS transporter [Salinivibrio sp. IB868]OOE76752.1 MFS transporter [Salinivibrio sp. IB870]OOE83805.1 MFS transporter [Salinivibrio siamensis]